MKVIIYKRSDGISIVNSKLPEKVYEENKHLVPDDEKDRYLLGLYLCLGEKDVPAGCPFWIVDSSILPTDRKNRNSWTFEETSEPSGVGLSREDFLKKYPEILNPAVIEKLI